MQLKMNSMVGTSVLLLFVVMCLLVSGTTAFFGTNDAVVTLTPENFDKEVMESGPETLWLIEFYAPWCGHCKRLTPEWKKAAEQLKTEAPEIKLGAVDADKHRELGSRYEVQGFPTIKMFGADKTAPSDYSGGRTSAAIIKKAKAALAKMQGKEVQEEDEEEPKAPADASFEGSDVVTLNAASFEKEVVQGKEGWLVEFYAPWCGHCKSLTPEWKKAATQLLDSGIRLAAVDATVESELAAKYQVNGFPTVKFFAPGGENPEDYNGERTAEGIIKFALRKSELYPGTVPRVQQIADQAMLKEKCLDKAALCVVFVVPHVIDTGAAGRNATLDLLTEAVKKNRGKPAAFGWIVGGEHEQFEERFNVVASYPTAIVISGKKLRFAVHKGAFTVEAITTSIKKIMSGKIGTSEIKTMPELAKNVPLWDGKDYEAPAEDEDY